MSDKIGMGDFVRVDFNGAQCTLTDRAEVLHVPCATGDSWIIRLAEQHNPQADNIVYISEGCTITKLKP